MIKEVAALKGLVVAQEEGPVTKKEPTGTVLMVIHAEVHASDLHDLLGVKINPAKRQD